MSELHFFFHPSHLPDEGINIVFDKSSRAMLLVTRSTPDSPEPQAGEKYRGSISAANLVYLVSRSEKRQENIDRLSLSGCDELHAMIIEAAEQISRSFAAPVKRGRTIRAAVDWMRRYSAPSPASP